MTNQELQNAFSKFLKPTRRLILEPGEPGQVPITKVGGVPWWPAGVDRPHCPAGHAMSFIAQILLSDVPELGPDDLGLLSFHYCQECSYEGNMAFGWASHDCDWINPEEDAKRYNLTIFTDLNSSVDGLGVIAEDIETPHRVISFVNRIETPSLEDARLTPELSRVMETTSSEELSFMLNDAYDFDDSRFPDLVHVSDTKLGGWPSWVQNPEWPRDYPDEEIIFVAQLAPMGELIETWCNGLAYLFIHPTSYTDRKAKFLLQDS